MISIIICSRNTAISSELSNNIQDTIGVEYELVVIDNSQNVYSIFQAYNIGVGLSKYPYLCFMHDDILLLTDNWGIKVIKHFENLKVGIIGAAGSHYLPKLPGSHWSSGITSYSIVHNVDEQKQHDRWKFTSNTESSAKAVLIDGLWFCVPKTIMDKVRFDDKTFSGFHCYDADICLQILNLNYEVRIIFNVTVEHSSVGARNGIWLHNIFLFYNKWKRNLPINTVELTKYKISEANYLNAKELIEQIKINDFSWIYSLKVFLAYTRINPPINRRNIRYFKLIFQIIVSIK